MFKLHEINSTNIEKPLLEKIKNIPDRITDIKELDKPLWKHIEILDDVRTEKNDMIEEGIRYTTADVNNETKNKTNEANESKETSETREPIENKKEGLTDEEKNKIKEETGWSDEIIDAIGSWKEYEIYKKAGLIEVEIGGRKCLIRNDIDWDKKWETGKYDEDGNPKYETNRERVANGKAPLDKNGNPIQLHHIGQHADSPLAELTFEEHRCNGNDTILHDKTKETETHGEGNMWDKERQDYWKSRAEYNEGENSNG